MNRFPIFLDLSQRKITVFGGGNIATRRILALLSHGATIQVIAPSFSDLLQDKNKELTLIHDTYDKKYLQDTDIVIGATDVREVNHGIYLAAKKRKILVNIVDCKEECDFYFPAVFENDVFMGGIVSKEGSHHHGGKKIANNLRIFLENNHE